MTAYEHAFSTVSYTHLDVYKRQQPHTLTSPHPKMWGCCLSDRVDKIVDISDKKPGEIYKIFTIFEIDVENIMTRNHEIQNERLLSGKF